MLEEEKVKFAWSYPAHEVTPIYLMWRRQDLGQAFRSDRQLQQFLLTDVVPTGRVLGTGSYGSVEEVSPLSRYPTG